MSQDNTPFPSNLEARWKELSGARARLLEAVGACQPRRDEERPEPGRWSPAEIVYHLYLSEKSSARALKKALVSGDRHEPAGDERLRAEWERVRQVVAVRGAPAKAPAFVAPDGAPALDAAVELLKQTRQALIETVAGTTYEQLLCISLPHPFESVGLLTGAGWLSFIAAHEERHTRQIEALLY